MSPSRGATRNVPPSGSATPSTRLAPSDSSKSILLTSRPRKRRSGSTRETLSLSISPSTVSGTITLASGYANRTPGSESRTLVSSTTVRISCPSLPVVRGIGGLLLIHDSTSKCLPHSPTDEHQQAGENEDHHDDHRKPVDIRRADVHRSLRNGRLSRPDRDLEVIGYGVAQIQGDREEVLLGLRSDLLGFGSRRLRRRCDVQRQAQLLSGAVDEREWHVTVLARQRHVLRVEPDRGELARYEVPRLAGERQSLARSRPRTARPAPQ